MRRIGLLGTVGLAGWVSAVGLFTIMAWTATEPSPTTMCIYHGLLAGAMTATLTQAIRARIPVRISYDLGWQQGYRTAEAKYRKLVERSNPPKN